MSNSVYTKDGKYYINNSMTHKLVEIKAGLDVNGDIDFKVVGNEIEFEPGTQTISVDKIKEQLTKPKVDDYKKTEEKKYNDIKKTNRFNRTI